MKKRGEFYTIQEWMHQHGLRPLELLLFARIYSMSIQELWYIPTTEQTAAFFGVSKPTVLGAIDRLLDLGLVEKNDVTDRTGVHRVLRAKEEVVMSHYIADGGKETLLTSVKKFYRPDGEDGKEILPGVVKNLYGGGKEILPTHLYIDKTNYNINDNSDSSCPDGQPAPADAVAPVATVENPLPVELPLQVDEEPTGGLLFANLEPSSTKNHSPRKEKSSAKKEKAPAALTWDQFSEECVTLGAAQPDADGFTEARKDKNKGKKNPNTPHAMAMMKNALRELREVYGFEPGFVFHVAAKRGWAGIQATYIDTLRAEARLEQDKSRAATTGAPVTPASRPAYNRPAPAPVDNLDNIKQRSAELSSALGDMFSKNI